MPRGHERMDFPWISPISGKGFHRVVEGVFHFVANPRVSLSLFSHWISASFNLQWPFFNQSCWRAFCPGCVKQWGILHKSKSNAN